MSEIKPDALVLDATAANRMVWRKKDDARVLFIDIEPELEIKPDLVCDCTDTGFPDKSFHTIIFDPPHWWGDEIAENIYTLRNADDVKKFNDKYGTNMHQGYYGTDKVKTRRELVTFLHKAQKEIYRILWDNGLLWFNWSEVKIPLGNILSIFVNWDEMIRLEIGSKSQTRSKHQNYWLMFMKKDRPKFQSYISSFSQDFKQKAE